jgi:putative phosphoribosyl transferase
LAAAAQGVVSEYGFGTRKALRGSPGGGPGVGPEPGGIRRASSPDPGYSARGRGCCGYHRPRIADLDIALTRKLGAPSNPELAIGAVSENGPIHIQHGIADRVGADEDYIKREIARQFAEIEVRRQRYRQVLPKVSLEGRTAILVDDGVATGATMEAALWAARDERPKEVIVAVPVGAQDAIARLQREADDVVCPYVPPYFQAIAQFYADFRQVGDEEVMEILRAQSQQARDKGPKTED